MGLQPYVKQLRPRNESYVPHVDKVQNFLSEAFSIGIVDDSDIPKDVTSNQDFFGISIMEATYCNCTPLLPQRLSYPELFNNKNLFYNNEKELIIKLKDQINSFPTIDTYREIAFKFDWKKISHNYDTIMNTTLNNIKT